MRNLTHDVAVSTGLRLDVRSAQIRRQVTSNRHFGTYTAKEFRAAPNDDDTRTLTWTRTDLPKKPKQPSVMPKVWRCEWATNRSTSSICSSRCSTKSKA